jgi:hypothetical protein
MTAGLSLASLFGIPRSQHRQHELIRRHKRDTLATLAALDRQTYRGLLLDSLEEHEQELAELEGETWQED